MPCGDIYAGREGETFRFRIIGGSAVCRGQLVSVDSATKQRVGEETTYTDQQLRAGISIPLQGGAGGRAYTLLLGCAPAGADLVVEAGIQAPSPQQCTVGPGDVGPWIITVPPAAAATQAVGGGGGGA